MTAPPSLIAARYRVLRELGRGGMGVVYVVEHIHTGDHLALKVLLGQAAQDSGAIERFKREARASARIKSENVVKVVDADVAPELDGAPFLVMELLNGTDLQRYLETRGQLPPAEALQFLTQAARALDRSHAIGIVHRDLKPENLFLHQREDGTTILKILDFGISKVIGGDSGSDIASAGVTSTGSIMGTPLYMSPEQARGRIAEIGPATDVWAMGLIALQLLTGTVYWRAGTVAELMASVLAEPLYAPSTRWAWIPPAVDAWFARSCARDRTQRFQSVGEQIEALGAALRDQRPLETATLVEPQSRWAGGALAPVPAVTGGRTTTPATAEKGTTGSPRGRAGTLVAGGALAACAVVAAGVFLYRGSGAPAHGAGLDAATLAALPAEPALDVHPKEPVVDAAHDACAAGSVQCTGAIPRTCTAGQWVIGPVTAATCGAACTPGSSPPRCSNSTPQICDSSGQWQNDAPCDRSSTCRDGVCRRNASPGVPGPPPPRSVGQPPPTTGHEAKPDCDPNFYFDAKGEKRFKPECFGVSGSAH